MCVFVFFIFVLLLFFCFGGGVCFLGDLLVVCFFLVGGRFGVVHVFFVWFFLGGWGWGVWTTVRRVHHGAIRSIMRQ